VSQVSQSSSCCMDKVSFQQDCLVIVNHNKADHVPRITCRPMLYRTCLVILELDQPVRYGLNVSKYRCSYQLIRPYIPLLQISFLATAIDNEQGPNSNPFNRTRAREKIKCSSVGHYMRWENRSIYGGPQAVLGRPSRKGRLKRK
jgi:hypothetical protein